MNNTIPHILVVDDEPDLEFLILQRFRKQIKDAQYKFSFALNGKEALEKLIHDESISLLMTDINMPLMDGLTLLNELKTVVRPIKSIVVSAYSDLSNIRTAMNRGAFDFVTKPIDFADLETTLQKTIQEQKIIEEGIVAKINLNSVLLEKEKVEQSARFKQQFLANMSHEIRTPLNAVVGMTNLLIEKEPRDDQRKYLDSMKLASNNLLGIINDILDISKIEAGKIILEEIDFDLHLLIDSVYQTLNHLAENSRIKLTVDLSAHLPQWLKGDPTKLTQILTNLVGNALKFTEENGSITIRCSSENKYMILFEVEDTGIGITQEQMSNLFESFTQASNDTTRKYGGTGLGLAISKQLVELQGGELNVKSEKGKGTNFFFKIPYSSGMPHDLIAIHKHESQIIARKLTILLAEDQPMNQMVAIDTLEGLFPGIIVDVANNGEEAIKMFPLKKYDIIFMDIHMPVLDGYETTKIIRSLNSSIPIVALTANVIKEEIDKCYDVGMNRHLSKPFEPTLLKTTVLDLVN